MSTEDVIRAWKDPEFRVTLTETIPDHPAGEIELVDPGLDENAARPALAGTLVARGTGCLCLTHKCL